MKTEEELVSYAVDRIMNVDMKKDVEDVVKSLVLSIKCKMLIADQARILVRMKNEANKKRKIELNLF